MFLRDHHILHFTPILYHIIYSTDEYITLLVHELQCCIKARNNGSDFQCVDHFGTGTLLDVLSSWNLRAKPPPTLVIGSYCTRPACWYVWPKISDKIIVQPSEGVVWHSVIYLVNLIHGCGMTFYQPSRNSQTLA